MKVRNIFENGLGGYNCEIEHQEYGWIPTTITSDDPETAAMYSEITTGLHGEIGFKNLLAEQTPIIARGIRTTLLNRVNTAVSNPLIWESLTENSKDIIRAYRSSLINLDCSAVQDLKDFLPEMPECLVGVIDEQDPS